MKMLLLLVTSLLCVAGGVAGGGAGEFQVLDRCTDSHVAAAVESMQLCAPRPVIVALPWPSNKQIHQVTRPYRVQYCQFSSAYPICKL